MVTTWRRVWDAPDRRWRAEPQAPAPGGLSRPNLPHLRPRPGARAEGPPPGPGAAPGPARRPRVLFINQYYWPDHASTAQHLTDLAEAVAAQGYECHVLCSRGGYRPGAAGRLPAAEVRNGVHIHRVGATSFGRGSTLARMTDYLSFYGLALARGLALPRFDAVVTLTTPPLIGLVGTLLRRLKRSKHVIWSMDLHPEVGLGLGRLSARNPLIAALVRLSNAVYRKADTVVALGPYMADLIRGKGVRAQRLKQIPVWSRRDEVYPLPRPGHPLREELGLAGRFVAMYSGNLGLAHLFDEFLEAARRLRDRDEIVFLFVGDGPRLAEVREAKRAEGLDNIRLMGYFPRERLHASLSVADVHLISMRPEVTGSVVPGKLYGAMASGRPTLFVGPDHCESADTIRRAGCGFTLRPGDVAGLVQTLTRLADDPERARELGERGRSAFLAEHEKEVCCDQWGRLLGELVGPPQPTPTPHTPARTVRLSGTLEGANLV